MVISRIFEYDQLILISPVVPHETVGFSGGNKYFFPGIGGEEIIKTFHWIGALITNPVVNGVMRTPVRDVIDRSASLISVPRLCFAFVVEDAAVTSLFIGSPEESWAKAAECLPGFTFGTSTDHTKRFSALLRRSTRISGLAER